MPKPQDFLTEKQIATIDESLAELLPLYGMTFSPELRNLVFDFIILGKKMQFVETIETLSDQSFSFLFTASINLLMKKNSNLVDSIKGNGQKTSTSDRG